MYYSPRHFQPEEFFTRATVNDHKNRMPSIWRLIDSRITWTGDSIRDHFGCSVIVNNYLFGGNNEFRGYRPVIEIAVLEVIMGKTIITSKVGSFTSQHCQGRGIDFNLEKYTAEEVRQDILKNPNAKRYRYVTALETGVSWVHIDCRHWDKSKGILTFQR